MSASPSQRAARQATKVAAVALARDGHSTAEIAKILGKSARYIRAAVQDEDLSPPPADAAPKKRKEPRAFKQRRRDQQGLGRVLVDPDILANVQPGDSIVVPDPRRPGEFRVLVKTKRRDAGPGYIGGLPVSARFTLP